MNQVREAVAALKKAEDGVPVARDALAKAIAAALKAGVRPVDLEPEVPYKREHIRRLARSAGAPPLREATVVSKKSRQDD